MSIVKVARKKAIAPYLKPVQVYSVVREMGTERDSFSFGANFYNFASPPVGMLSGEWPHNICITFPHHLIDLFTFEWIPSIVYIIYHGPFHRCK